MKEEDLDGDINDFEKKTIHNCFASLEVSSNASESNMWVEIVYSGLSKNWGKNLKNEGMGIIARSSQWSVKIIGRLSIGEHWTMLGGDNEVWFYLYSFNS